MNMPLQVIEGQFIQTKGVLFFHRGGPSAAQKFILKSSAVQSG